MLANKAIVKQFVKSVTDMRSDGWNRRFWADKNKKDKTLRNLAFRFFNGAEAAKVAEELSVLLFTAGYTNKVKLTSTYERRRDMFDRSVDSYYVRVIAAQ